MYLRSVANGNLQRSPQPLISIDWTSCPRSCCLNCVELAVALGTGVALRPYCRFKPGELWESRPPCSDHASKRQRIGIRLVGGSSPPSPTTQSYANRDFPLPAECALQAVLVEVARTDHVEARCL